MVKYVGQGHTRATRRLLRRNIGPLFSSGVTIGVKKRYENQLLIWFLWLESRDASLPETWDQLNDSLCEFIEHQWQDGAAKTDVGDLLSGVAKFVRRSRKNLGDSWLLYTYWGKHELPTRATPFTPRQAVAMYMMASDNGWFGMAVIMLVGFHCMLRTGEMRGIRAGDVSWSPGKLSAVLHLGLTKGGRRKGLLNEMVTITDANVLLLLELAMEGLQPGDLLDGASETTFRRRFNRCLQDLHMQGDALGYLPYSLRRGGATHCFRISNSLDFTTVRGRWENVKTARIYIDDGLTKMRESGLALKALAAIEGSYRRFIKLLSAD